MKKFITSIEKGKKFYSSESHFKDNKWIGQNILSANEGINVKIYSSNGTFIYTSDSITHDSTGACLDIYAEYLFVYNELIVTGVHKQGYCEIKLLNCRRPYSTTFSFIIKAMILQ